MLLQVLLCATIDPKVIYTILVYVFYNDHLAKVNKHAEPLIKQHFNKDDMEIFELNFKIYLANDNNKNGFIIDLEDIYKFHNVCCQLI